VARTEKSREERKVRRKAPKKTKGKTHSLLLLSLFDSFFPSPSFFFVPFSSPSLFPLPFFSLSPKWEERKKEGEEE